MTFKEHYEEISLVTKGQNKTDLVLCSFEDLNFELMLRDCEDMSKHRDKDWCPRTGQEVVDFLNNPKTFEKSEVSYIPDESITKKRKKLNTLCGGGVSVPKYLNGHPIHFTSREHKNVKSCRLVLSISVLSSVNNTEYKKYINKMKELLEYIVSTHDVVDLYVGTVIDNYNTDSWITSLIHVLKAGKYQNIDLTMSLFEDVSFFRRIMFSLYANAPYDRLYGKKQHGYGRNCETIKKFKETLENVGFTDNCHAVPIDCVKRKSIKELIEAFNNGVFKGE